MWTIQMNAERSLVSGTLIVCNHANERNGYRILARGTYAEMMRLQWPNDGEQTRRMETLVNAAMKVGA
jgi:hypothetical protein